LEEIEMSSDMDVKRTLLWEFDGDRKRARSYAERIAAARGSLSDQYARVAEMLKTEVKKSKVSLKRIMAACERDDLTGFCLACGEDAYNVEPDATNYPCEHCGARKVFGAQELLIMRVA
jgi:hypothetical protein